MNAEIYFPREGKSFGQTSEKNFEKTIKKLNDIDVNIIYKTEINLTEKSLLEALKVTDSGNEKIAMVFIADALSDDNAEKAKEFFSSIGVIGKIKRIEVVQNEDFSIDDKKPDNSENYLDKKTSKKEAKLKKQQEKQLEKLHKQQEKQLKKQKMLNTVDNTDAVVKNTLKKQNNFFAYSAEHNGKLIVILPKPEFVDSDFNTLLFSVANTVVNPKGKESFWKRFIPCTGDRPVDVVRKVILLLAVCTFVVSSYMLIDVLIVEPAISDNTNQGIRDMVVSTDENSGSGSTKKPTDGSEGELADFKQLLEVNPDTIGWIKIPNTVIDYVVVKPSEKKDHEYYLYRDFYGNDSKYGTIFMDYRSTLDSKNLIIHGHHMQDGRMFANLKHFADLDFYKKTPTFTFNTIYEKSKWKIISVFKTNTLESQGEFFNYLRGDFKNDYDFLNFIYNVRERSIIDCPVDVNENDTLVTLSTCAYDFDEFRLVVVARKVRDGEKTDVDVSKADYNPNPLYPDIWYKTYGGTAPKITTFQDAYNKGEIKWYDGKKKDWSADDDDLLSRELNEAKTKSLQKLKNYVSKNKYADEEKKKVDKLLEDYSKQIKSATDADKLKSIYEDAMKEIQKVKTEEQLASEQRVKEESDNIIKNARSSAITDMTNSIAGNTYRDAEYKEVKNILNDYTDKINQEKDIDRINAYKEQCIKELSKIKTHDEYNAEESKQAEESRKAAEEESKAKEQKLKEARKSAISELENYVSLSEYDENGQEQIRGIISSYTEKINNSDSESDVEKQLSLAKEKINEVKTSQQESQESSEQESSTEVSEETSVDSEEA